MVMPNTFFEHTLENIIMDNIGLVQERGLPNFYKNTRNQFPLPDGKVCDIFSYEIIDNKLFCKVYELKRAQLGLGSVIQALDYCQTIIKYTIGAFDEINIRPILVGTDVNEELLSLYAWGVNIGICTYDYKIDGIQFESWEPLGEFPASYWITRPSELFTAPSKDLIQKFVQHLNNL